MKDAFILKKGSDILKIHAINVKPHNIIFFDDNEFMKHVKDVLWDNYHITSIMLNNPKDIMMACSIGEWKYDKSITGFLYISSRSIIDQYMELEDYSDKVYEKEVIIKL